MFNCNNITVERNILFVNWNGKIKNNAKKRKINDDDDDIGENEDLVFVNSN